MAEQPDWEQIAAEIDELAQDVRELRQDLTAAMEKQERTSAVRPPRTERTLIVREGIIRELGGGPLSTKELADRLRDHSQASIDAGVDVMYSHVYAGLAALARAGVLHRNVPFGGCRGEVVWSLVQLDGPFNEEFARLVAELEEVRDA